MESREKYRLLFENSKEVVFITTPDGRYLDINPAGVELFGYSSKEEMLGLDIGNDIYANPDERKAFIRKLEENGYVKDFRMVLKRKDGKILIVLSTATAVRDENGDIVAYQGINHDLTDLEQRSAEMQENLERLDLALKSGDMGVWGWDVVNRKIYFDEQSFRLLGIDPSTFAGTIDEYYEVVHPDDRALVRGNLYRSLKGEDLSKDEYRIIRPDGSTRYITGRWKAIRDEAGRPVKLHGIHWDVTDRRKAEDALKETHDLLRVIIDTAPTAIIGLDLEGKVQTVWNRAAETMLGWSAQEAMGRFLPSVPVENEEEFRRFRERIRNGKSLMGVEVRREKSDGARIDYSIYASPLHDKDGAVSGNIAVLVDITERKRMEEALRESEERLKATLDAAHIVAWEINVDGSHHEAGPVHELFGRPDGFHHPELPDLFRSIHPEDRESMESLVESALRGEREYQAEFRVLLSDGTVRWIETTGSLQRDAQGNPTRILGIARNVTERKRMEEALRESEERFKRLIQNSNDIIALIDEAGNHISISGPLEKILGYKPEELAGGSAYDLLHPDDVGNIKKVFQDIVRQPGSSRTVECRLRHKTGKWVAVEAVGSNLLHDPAVRAVVSNIREITERNKLLEQLQQAMKMEAVGRLAGGIAHDFNNILTVISGNVELARMALNPSDPLNRCLDQVMKASESAASLTRQLLAFSRKQIIEPKVLNLNDLVLNIRQMLGRLIGENVELQTVLCDNLGSVKVDPGQFEQVLVNLAVNARDAMPGGGSLVIETANITVDERYCATHPQTQPGNYVRLSVRDTGHGMSKEVKEHLFEPFFTTKGKGHGTGLGLATIFGVVKQAGGAIEAYSEEGQGTTFEIFLPLLEQQAEKLVKEKPALDILKGDETILLVEDEESVRRVAAIILKDLGYRTIEARNGEEALMLAERHGERIDLLMTDIVMPGINGRELSERLTRLDPGMKTLFTSGYTENIIVHHRVIEENLNFIGKPYTVQALAGKIREVLGPGRSRNR